MTEGGMQRLCVSRRLGIAEALLAGTGLLVGGSGLARRAEGRERDPAASTHLLTTCAYPLGGQNAIQSGWERAARLGPTFDGHRGMVFKLFLLDGAAPSLVAFAVWATPGHAMTYLRSPEFAREAEVFGRPRVQLALLIAETQPSADLREVSLVADDASGPGIKWLNASDGSRGSLLYKLGRGHTLEVAYVARGDAE